jgi:hypothetical protein
MRYFIGVASREHVLAGVREGFAQFAHGRRTPAQRLMKGDWVIYYSPKERIFESGPCQRFTAIGQVIDDQPVQIEQDPGFAPWRRRVAYRQAHEVGIGGLLGELSFIADKSKWGVSFRFGLFEIPRDDFMKIANQMVTGFQPG